jgi:H+/Cl- antiporter ClcA
MRARILEQSVLFISVVKWFVLATVTGVFVGFSTTVFLKCLEYASGFAGGYGYYYLLLPLAMFVSTLLVKYLAPEAEGHGTEKIIEAVHRRKARINPMVVPVKLLATVVTIALGGSAGKEGPCAQIGAGIAATFAKVLSFDDRDRKKLVICGISAGFATVFGTPIAGAMFGVEVLFVGTVLYDVLFPSFVAGIVGYQVSSMLGVSYLFHSIEVVPEFSGMYFLQVCASGVFFGFCAFVLIGFLKQFEKLSRKITVWKPLKGLIGGSAIVALVFLVGPGYLGLGVETIESSLNGEQVAPLAFLLKSLFTSITLSFGGSGGIVTPIFFVGSTSGSLFADLLGLDMQVFAAIGMVSLLAGAANTPIAAIIMAAELFGPQVAPYAALACIISFLMTGHRSVYPSQVLAVAKSSSLAPLMGRTMEEINGTTVKPRSRSITGKLITGYNIAKRSLRSRSRRRPPKV